MAFAHARPALWDSLPQELKDSNSSTSFIKCNLKTNLFNCAFWRRIFFLYGVHVCIRFSCYVCNFFSVVKRLEHLIKMDMALYKSYVLLVVVIVVCSSSSTSRVDYASQIILLKIIFFFLTSPRYHRLMISKVKPLHKKVEETRAAIEEAEHKLGMLENKKKVLTLSEQRPQNIFYHQFGNTNFFIFIGNQ